MNQLINQAELIRIEKEYSLRAISEAAKMPYPCVYKIFHGKQIPQINTFEKLLDAMGYKLVIAPKD